MKLILKTLLAIVLVVGIVTIAVSCGGCAQGFEAPELEPIKSGPIELCAIGYDNVPWALAKDGFCKGWVRI